MSRIAHPFEPCKDNVVNCPHCESPQNEGVWFGDTEYECPECGKEFYVDCQFSVAKITWEDEEEDESMGNG